MVERGDASIEDVNAAMRLGAGECCMVYGLNRVLQVAGIGEKLQIFEKKGTT